jgi:hypothetical protein
MKETMPYILKHAWLLFIGTLFINALIFKLRAKKLVKEDPSLEKGYNDIIKGWVGFGMVPFIIMGIGQLSNSTSLITDYFHPAKLNPFVILFHLSIVVIWVIGSNWIFRKNGAEFLSKHPGLFQNRSMSSKPGIMSPRSIKITWAMGVMGGIVAMVMMWSGFFSDMPSFTAP